MLLLISFTETKLENMKGIQRSRQLIIHQIFKSNWVWSVATPFCIPRNVQFRTITRFFSFSLEGVIGNVLIDFCVIAFTHWIIRLFDFWIWFILITSNVTFTLRFSGFLFLLVNFDIFLLFIVICRVSNNPNYSRYPTHYRNFHHYAVIFSRQISNLV